MGPLPDERPRPSVANLIGRFEKQKATSSTSTVPIIPRTSSVASHRTGDSAVEEAKEKREWPPKSTHTPAPALVSPTPTPVPVVTPPPSDLSPNPDSGEVKAADTPSAPPENIVEFVPPVEVTPPTPAVATAPYPTPPVADPSPSMSSKSKPATSTVTTKATPTKVKSDHTPGASRTSIIKSTAKGSSTGSTPAPTKSTSSTPAKTPVKPAGASRISASKPLTSTPDRAKSPSETGKRTPSSLSRPKTPSRLYTPTAASLARRVGVPPPPPVEKPKRKPTTDLTKPTAASASKMRSPVATTTATPSRSSKPAVTKSTIKSSPIASKTASTIRSTVKSSSRPANGSATRNNLVARGPQVATSAGTASVVMTDGLHEEETVIQTADDEVRTQHSKGEDEIESYDDDFPDESHEPPIVNEPEQVSVDENSPELQKRGIEDQTSETVDATSNVNENPSDFAGEPQATESVVVESTVESEIKSSPGAGTELEDLVNMLETAPKVEGPSLEAVAGEIPDEH